MLLGVELLILVGEEIVVLLGLVGQRRAVLLRAAAEETAVLRIPIALLRVAL